MKLADVLVDLAVVFAVVFAFGLLIGLAPWLLFVILVAGLAVAIILDGPKTPPTAQP